MISETEQTFSGAVAPILEQIEERYPGWELLFVYGRIVVNNEKYFAVLKIFDGYKLLKAKNIGDLAQKVYDILTGTVNLIEEAPFLAGKGSSVEFAFWDFMVSERPECRLVVQKDIVDYVRGVNKKTGMRYSEKDGHALEFIRAFIFEFLKRYFIGIDVKTNCEVI